MKRVLLKISGEVLGGADGQGLDEKPLMALCSQLAELRKMNIALAIVVGGGNYWRYRDQSELGIPRSASDTIGMMATLMNARLLEEVLNAKGVSAKTLSPHVDPVFAEKYSPTRGKELLEQGVIVICGGGTGSPYFTTDTAAALRALELDCEVLIKATKVNGVYETDPVKSPDAKFYEELTYAECLEKELKVMDLTSIVLCQENALPVRVFNGTEPGNLVKLLSGEKVGSLIH